MKAREESVPRARREGLLVQELPDELLVYDLVSHKAHCLNRTAALVWNRCDGKTSVGQLVRLLEKETDASVDHAVVWMAFDQLSKARLLQGRARTWPGASTISRRELIRRVGTAAAIALPIVSSIVVPGAIQAATCLPTGASCTSSAQCCSGVCNGTCA
jgi:coenzyme PQQ synthesis protein D (PqqD)